MATSSEEEFTLLTELQLLCSMYESSQIHFDDQEIRLLLEQSETPIKSSVSLTLKLHDDKLRLHLRLAPTSIGLSISGSCQIRPVVANNVEAGLNQELTNWLKTNEPGTSEAEESRRGVLDVVNWLNDWWEENVLAGKVNVDNPGTSSSSAGGPQNVSKNDSSATDAKSQTSSSCCRLWIHSHHIYNTKKRKFIMDQAKGLGLKGFSLPGKPGFVCVEGDEDNCDNFWEQVRRLTWQKISLIEKQHSVPPEFESFEELRMDMSEFMGFLRNKDVHGVIGSYIFQK